MAKKRRVPQKLQIWIEVRKKYNPTHAQIQMARELGMNPKGFGKLANQRQESWKLPLAEFIERCYFKRFRKSHPDNVLSIEQKAKEKMRLKESNKSAESTNRDAPDPEPFDDLQSELPF